MKKQDFILGLVEEMELETPITLDTNIKNIDEWDSMNAMILIGFVSDNFGVTLTSNDLEKISTIESIIEIIGIEKFE